MEKLPKSVRDSLARQQGAESHPDADLLNAFGEGSTTERERQTVLAHLAACPDCRRVVALAHPETAGAGEDLPERTEVGGRGWLRRWMWAPALAAVAVVAISGSLLLRREEAKRESAKNEQNAPATYISEGAQQKESAPAGDASSQPKPGDASSMTKQRKLAPPSSGTSTSAATSADAKTGDARTKRARSDGENQVASAVVKSDSADLAAKEKVNPATLASKVARADTGSIHGTTSEPQQPYIGGAEQTVEVTAAAPMVAVGEANAPAAVPAQPTRRAAANDYRAMGGLVAGKQVGPHAQGQNQNAQSEAVQTANVQRKSATAEVASSRAAASDERRAAPSAPPPPPPPPTTDMGYTDRMAKALPAGAVMRASWRIDSSGRLLRSVASGPYAPVMTETRTVFRAVFVNGSDIWAGGNEGALYHSADNGAHWNAIEIKDGGRKVTANITGVRFQDALHGTVRTESGESWSTADGGASWTK